MDDLPGRVEDAEAHEHMGEAELAELRIGA